MQVVRYIIHITRRSLPLLSLAGIFWQLQSRHVVAVAVAVAVVIVVVVDYRVPLCMWLTELLSLLVFYLSGTFCWVSI